MLVGYCVKKVSHHQHGMMAHEWHNGCDKKRRHAHQPDDHKRPTNFGVECRWVWIRWGHE